MTDLLSDVDTPSDAELISRVRGGDVAAYGDLFARHQAAAQRLARQLVRGIDADDLVSEAFAKVLTVLQGGGGPDVAFRAYLLTAVRRLHVDKVRSGQRLQTTDDMTPFDPGVPFQDTAVAGFESGAAAKAFASLPERWQLVLWHLEVEGQKPADIAPLLGMSANSVSALAYRAREGLRQAFLTMHISDITETDCRWVNEHLGAYVRKGLAKRDAAKVQAHLDNCRRCTAMYLELTEVNSNLAGIIAPLLLGAAATGYVASGGAGAAGILGVLGRGRDFVVANTGAVTAAGVGAAVVAAAVTAVTLGLGGGGKPSVVADPTTSSSLPAATSPASPGASSSTTTSPSTTASPSVTISSSPSSTASLAPSPSGLPAAVESPSDTPADTSSPTDEPGGPTDEPTTPASPAVSDVDIDGTSITDDAVLLNATGSPSLPATMTVDLTSTPAGAVSFGEPSDCTVSADGQSATCATGAGGGAGGARVPGGFARAAAAESFSANLPLEFSSDVDTDVSVSVTLPDGYRISGGGSGTRSFVSKVADVALTLDAPDAPTAPKVHTLTAHVAGVPDAFGGGTTYALGGDAAFSGTAPDDCTYSDATTATCTTAVATRTFEVTTTDDAATLVSLTVGHLKGYRDPHTADNTARATLTKYVPPTKTADVKLSAPDQVAADDDGTYAFNASVTGVPNDYAGKLRISVTQGDAEIVDASTGCALAGSELVCDGSNGAVRVHLRATDNTSNTPVTLSVAPLTGYADDDLGNNDADLTLLRVASTPSPHTDLGLTALSPADPVPGDDGRYHVSTTLTVDGEVPPSVTFTADGATFAAGTDCSVADDGTSVTCMNPTAGMHVDFVLSAPTDVATDVTVAVSALGWDEDHAADNSRDVTLQPAPPAYDVALSGLTPLAATADTQGVQRFTANLDRDGWTGPVSFALADAPAGTSLTSVISGGTVTFTVKSTATTSHRLAITAVVADAANDPDATNNTAASTWSPHQYDVALSGLTPVTPNADANGAQKFTATLDKDGWTGALTYSLVDGPAGATFSSSVSGSTVTFTVTSSATSAHAVQVRVDAPAAANDPSTANNTVSSTWTPKPPPTVDVVLDSLVVQSRQGSTNIVKAQVSGVPSGSTKVRIDLSGANAGSGSGKVKFVDGANGADGEGSVDCAVVSDLVVECTKVSTAFAITMHVQHPMGQPDLPVTMTVSVPGSNEPAGNLANNSREVTIR